MKKIIIALAALLLSGAGASAASKKDPVLLKVNGKEITLSEFEYLYNKSNSQQSAVQPVGEYLDMFINFKLKVADAEAARLDTTAAFRKELGEYRRQLAEPYMVDSAEIDAMVDEVYSHIAEEVVASHIMMICEGAEQRLDSIRNAILEGSITFEDAAREYSADRSAQSNGGHLGAVTAGRTPYLFENAMYATSKGEISPVVFSGIGYHIIRVEDRRPAKGEVQASHILKLTRGLSAEGKAAARSAIDSIYTLVTSGADFADMARRESDDPGSARQGGSLGWFGPGMMVQPFDSIAFAMADGAVSEPFETNFGYHIIKKYASRGIPPVDSLRESILAQLERDGRIQMSRDHFAEKLAAEYGGISPEEAVERYIGELPAKYPEYRNLLNEYRDGILLFDISNSRVWEKASSDEAKLEEYFRKNAGKYAWDKPRYKGYVLYATADTVLQKALRLVDGMGEDTPVDSVARELRREFGRNVKVERVLAAQGDNPAVDFVAFGGERPRLRGNWQAYAAIRGRVIDAPESVADVRGAVTTDYQTELEAAWLDELHKRYKVKVDKKVLKMVE